jgi:anti-anti-sigma regulatory factor
MTVSTHYGSPVFDCSGARLRAQSRRLATIVALSGDLTADNFDLMTEHASPFVQSAASVVLDLSGVTTMCPQAMALIRAFDKTCGDAGVDWALVPSRAVADVLSTDDVLYPIAESVPDALTYFADETLQRRSLLLPLLTKSA